jgi:peptidoglycan/xylan/chitin deacetylase (PgdA/CDA1 family)
MRAASSVRPPAAKPWRPPLIVKASVACHLGVGVAAVATPMDWPWAAGVIAANHAVLGLSGLWPRSTGLGQTLVCLPPQAARRGEVAITLDDGPDPDVTPAVLDILDADGARATFFCIAARAARHPAPRGAPTAEARG